MEPGTTMLVVSTAIETLKQLKQVFYDDKKNEAARRKTHEQVGVLAEEVASSKAAIEKHNDVLLGLTEAAQGAALELKKMKYLAYSSFVVSLASISASVYLLMK